MNNKQIQWIFVRKRTILTERLPLIGQFQYQLLRIDGCRVFRAAVPHGR
jgi:hypothetical protein